MAVLTLMFWWVEHMFPLYNHSWILWSSSKVFSFFICGLWIKRLVVLHYSVQTATLSFVLFRFWHGTDWHERWALFLLCRKNLIPIFALYNRGLDDWWAFEDCPMFWTLMFWLLLLQPCFLLVWLLVCLFSFGSFVLVMFFRVCGILSEKCWWATCECWEQKCGFKSLAVKLAIRRVFFLDAKLAGLLHGQTKMILESSQQRLQDSVSTCEVLV